MKPLNSIYQVIARSFLKKKKFENISTKQSRYPVLLIQLEEIAASTSTHSTSYFHRSSQRLLFLFIVGLLLTSCSIESLPINVEPAEEKIAVASLIGPEETFLVTLSRSFSALSAEDIDDLTEDAINRLLLDQALVTLEYQGITDTLENVFDIAGLFGTQLEVFEDYQLLKLSVFDSLTAETVSSEAMLMPRAEVDSISVTRRDTSVTFLADFSYNITDPAGDNFYVIQAYQLTDPDTTQSDSTNNDLFFSDQGFLIYEQLFTDRSAENGVLRKNDVLEFTSSTDSALVVITNISEGYYNFLEARKRSGGLVSSLANEPVNHPTNIQNGVGYFSAHQPRAVLVVVE